METDTAQRERNVVRVLVVDDEPALRQAYEAILVDAGCAVRTAGNGRKALQILMQESFDVLLVDLKMEEMDGIVFLQEALKIWPWLGVVIVSAYITEEVLPKAAELGVTRILEKPVTLQKLCGNVMEEAAAKRDRHTDIPHGNALSLMRDHLRILTDLGQKSIGAETLTEALAGFGKSLTGMLPCDIVGILVIEEKPDEPAVLFSLRRPLAEQMISRLESEMIARYAALSGRTLNPQSLHVQITGEKCDPAGPSEPRSTLSVPVILDNDVCGLVTLGAVDQERYSPAEVSLLYHAANHISAVFMALRRIHRLAARDPLTGIFNRIRLEEELDRAWLVSRRYGTSMGVVVVDIDNFKTVNDAYGHTVGDTILREFAEVMRNVTRGTDVIARYGGDEFIAILPRASDRDAYAFGMRLLNSTRSYVFCRNQYRLKLTISIGMSTSLNSTLPSTSSALLSQGDRALFMAKRAGRNRYCVWPGQTTAAVQDGVEPSGDAGPGTQEPARPTVRKESIVVVDDEPSILSLTRIMLEREGYDVVTCTSAVDAIDTVRQRPGFYDILLTDIGMPDKSGIDLIREVTGIDDSIVKVVMTGNATVDNAVSCLREGAYDFIEKPISRGQLTALVRRSLEYRNLKIENARYQAHLEDMCTERSAQLANSLEEIRRSYEFTLEALVAMLDAREHHTGRHSVRARELALTLARAMGLNGETLESIATGALLHDIGKIAIPDSILLKAGPLLPAEWEVMKQHPEIGYSILRSSPHLRDAAEIVRQHQEHYDGDGYPRGLRGEEICVGARIFAVTDAYDAMRSERVYRKSVGREEALAEIKRNAGTQFDPEAVNALVACQDDLERLLAEPVT